MIPLEQNWKMAYAHHDRCKRGCYCTIEALETSGFDIIPASVPGCLELDLMKAGKLKDLYFSTNTLEAQKLEDVHVWYYTVLDITDSSRYLHFEGIDTFAEIYVNGILVQTTDNMYLSYDVQADWHIGKNEVVVHIKPAMLETRNYVLPVSSVALKYNYPTLYARKAPHMFGWDIMPRIVSAGLWKEVSLREDKADKINEVYLNTERLEWKEAEGGCRAFMRFYINADLSGAFATDYSVRVEGSCGGSCFREESKLWHNTHVFDFVIEDCKLWWPKHSGKADLYDIMVTLLREDKACDEYRFRAGIRTVGLERTEVTDEEGNGEFCFRVNGKKIFVLGTNWVPLDAFHANDKNRLPRALELLGDIGCNMVRCWGGNVYESDEFYDYCDSHGILVWQDFSMGCAVYPDDHVLAQKLEEEAVCQVKRLRNHPALALWAGDNECDENYFNNYGSNGQRRNPNGNRLTRETLRRVVELHDYGRPYLPSSPYMSEAFFCGEGTMPEKHLWGPRDYFKGPYYRDTFCHFASETGYHGFPSPASLKKFLREPERIFGEDGTATEEYLVHAAGMELDPKAPYAYRIRLAYDQVVTLFGKAEENLEDFVRQSQISQAEAKKYFIEKFRIGKWKRTGIIWWNLLDGWPQVSDAVVDYYFVKKLAYHYIKRSQQPVCLMFDEPENGSIRLIGVNDLPQDKKIAYEVRKISGEEADDETADDETAEAEMVLRGSVVLSADSAVPLENLSIADGEKEFYLITWEMNGEVFRNHYVTNLFEIDYGKYMSALHGCGMDEFDGF